MSPVKVEQNRVNFVLNIGDKERGVRDLPGFRVAAIRDISTGDEVARVTFSTRKIRMSFAESMSIVDSIDGLGNDSEEVVLIRAGSVVFDKRGSAPVWVSIVDKSGNYVNRDDIKTRR